MTQHIAPEQLQQAAGRLEAMADKLGQISTWLSLGDLDQPAIMLEDSYRDIQAACNLLRRRIRTRPAGWLGSQPYSQYGPRSVGETGR